MVSLNVDVSSSLGCSVCCATNGFIVIVLFEGSNVLVPKQAITLSFSHFTPMRLIAAAMYLLQRNAMLRDFWNRLILILLDFGVVLLAASTERLYGYDLISRSCAQCTTW